MWSSSVRQTLLIVVVAFMITTVVAAAAPQVIPSSSYTYEAALQVHRKLQGTSPEICGGTIGDLISCYAAECATQPCDIEPGVTPEPPANAAGSGCDKLEEAFCSSFDSECCPPCASQTQVYLDCIVENSFLQIFCPDATCKASDGGGNVTIPEDDADGTMKPDANMTTIQNEEDEEEEDSIGNMAPGEEIPDDATEDGDEEDGEETDEDGGEEEEEGDVEDGTVEDPGWLARPCANELALIFSCYSASCDNKDCEAELDAVTNEVNEIENCGDFTETFCKAISAADECCPKCSEVTSGYSNCALKQEQVSSICPYAPLAECVPTDEEEEESNSASKTGKETSRANNNDNNNGFTDSTASTTESEGGLKPSIQQQQQPPPPPQQQQQGKPAVKPMLPIMEVEPDLESSNAASEMFTSSALVAIGLLLFQSWILVQFSS